MRALRVAAAVWTVLLAAAGADYYLDLGWFGEHAKLLLLLLMFIGVVPVLFLIRKENERETGG